MSAEPFQPDAPLLLAFQAFPAPVEVTAGSRMRLLLTHTDSLVYFTLTGGAR